MPFYFALSPQQEISCSVKPTENSDKRVMALKLKCSLLVCHLFGPSSLPDTNKDTAESGLGYNLSDIPVAPKAYSLSKAVLS